MKNMGKGVGFKRDLSNRPESLHYLFWSFITLIELKLN